MSKCLIAYVREKMMAWYRDERSLGKIPESIGFCRL